MRADTLLLTHTYNPGGRRTARIRRVALRVNDAGRPIELALVPDDWRKTVVSLGKMTRVRTLELQVLESSPGRAGEEGVGLAEVELQLRGRRR